MSALFPAVFFLIFCLFTYAILLLLIGIFRMVIMMIGKEQKRNEGVWNFFIFLFYKNEVAISHAKLLFISFCIVVFILSI